MSTALEEDPTPEANMNGNGQYVITPPDKKKGIGYTRATNITKLVADDHLIQRSSLRKACYGLARSKDLINLALGHHHAHDRRTYEDIVKQAHAVAKTSEAANEGTALHRFTDRLDSGRMTLDEMPEEHQKRLALYQQVMARTFEIDRDYIEVTLVLDKYKVAGTADRGRLILKEAVTIDFPMWPEPKTLEAGAAVIGDLKTGASVTLASLSNAVQMSIYANHDRTWIKGKEEAGPRIDVDKDVALIIHMPQSAQPAEVTLHWVDLRYGWDTFLTAMQVKEARRDDSKSMVTLSADCAEESIHQAAIAWIRDRIKTTTTHSDQAFQDVLSLWPEDVPMTGLDDFEFTPEQITRIALDLDVIEAKHEIAFGLPQPKEKQDGWAKKLTLVSNNKTTTK